MSEEKEFVESALEFDERLRTVARIDGHYDVQAYRFVFESLNHTIAKLSEPRHVTARELLDGIRELAKEKFGLLARTVFENWGLSSTKDFGEIVFSLVSYGLMGKTDEDRLEDFDSVYDFKEGLDDEYLAELSRQISLSS